jgi:hypothetical protein
LWLGRVVVAGDLRVTHLDADAFYVIVGEPYWIDYVRLNIDAVA